jgi:large subunit ribosomal protein L30
MAKTIRIKLLKSPIGFEKRQKLTIKALGFHKLHQTIEKEDTPAIRGMITAVQHLVVVEE